jgi:lactate permease
LSGVPLSPLTWLLAAAPVFILFATVLSGKLSTQTAAFVVLVTATIVGLVAFHADADVLLVAIGKGAWLGTWILGVVWPALLLYGVARAVGLERIGRVFARLLPQRREMLLLLAWVFPSFLQGVAGFGTPIAVCAPLLLAAGWSPVRSVVYPLIGYHWSVTFGSMGSSFYMAALTAHLAQSQQQHFAFLAASALALQCLLAGVLVLWVDGGKAAVREGARMVLLVGAAMGLTLMVVAVAVPAVASLSAGTAGFLAVLGMSAFDRRRMPRPVIAGGAVDVDAIPRSEDSVLQSLRALAPYVFLLLTALPVFLVPASRAWVSDHLLLAPSFPATTTGFGWTNAAVTDYTPIAVLGHPGFYVGLASLLGFLTYRLSGIWPDRPGVLRAWAASLPKSSLSILLLAALATVMADTGMVSVLARGTAAVTGGLYPALSPVIGGLGSFMTGSTTTSNALFAGLQRDVAMLLEVDPSVLLAAQTAGGNVGNAVAPVIVLIGATTVGEPHAIASILRRTWPAATLLFVVAGIVTVLRA